jgi:hypothetical protein
VVEGHVDLHEVSNDKLPFPDPSAIDGAAEAEQRHLGLVDDRR